MRRLPRPRRSGGPREAPRTDFAGEQPEHPAGLDRAELLGVADQHQPRPGGLGSLLDHRQVRRAELAGLIQHQHIVPVQRHGPTQLVGAFDLAEEL
ncbi:MAG: hypothetical protein WAL72_30995, partial [Streptosporangiaceae bacterium]